MKKLLSHGEYSDLTEHLSEVMTAAETESERIACALHDLGKAYPEWQAYIRKKRRDSPVNHAACGGILAGYLIWILSKKQNAADALSVFHAVAAHHSGLSTVSEGSLRDPSLIFISAPVHDFFMDREKGIASLLPEIPPETLEKAWDAFSYSVEEGLSSFMKELSSADFSERELTDIFFNARNMLGRMVFEDHQSAGKQSGKQNIVPDWRDIVKESQFIEREHITYGKTPLSDLRDGLRNIFLETVRKEALFYFIDAPTGLGKTESMLSAAESIQKRLRLEKIVYAVPRVSIADQIYEKYFSKASSAQIWNYLRKEKKIAEKKETVSDNNNEALALELTFNPFSESYNVTTFNQVLLAMFHPDRMCCERQLALRNAVIILDEFHKLPPLLLPFFSRLAKAYAQKYNCRFIFGSATPFDAGSRYLGFSDSESIPETISAPLYGDARIDARRCYRNIGEKTIEEIADRISEIHAEEPEDSLLVVLNLVEKGSWMIECLLGYSYQPWKQLKELQSASTERAVVFLDGLVPPGIRREIVRACKNAMKKRPVTLVTTQMVEVGVDLDFQHGLVDYQGLASTIQRGGRIGREGLTPDAPVEVFSLMIESRGETISSFKHLQDIQKPVSLQCFTEVCETCQLFNEKENAFFRKWTGELHDSELNKTLLSIQREIFGKNGLGDHMIQNLLSLQESTSYGLSMENVQYIAASVEEDQKGFDILILEQADFYEEMLQLVENYEDKEKRSPENTKKLFQLLNSGIIHIYKEDMIVQMKLDFAGNLPVFDLRVYVPSGGNIP